MCKDISLLIARHASPFSRTAKTIHDKTKSLISEQLTDTQLYAIDSLNTLGCSIFSYYSVISASKAYDLRLDLKENGLNYIGEPKFFSQQHHNNLPNLITLASEIALSSPNPVVLNSKLKEFLFSLGKQRVRTGSQTNPSDKSLIKSLHKQDRQKRSKRVNESLFYASR